MHTLLVAEILASNNCAERQGTTVDDIVLEHQHIIGSRIGYGVNTRHHTLAVRLNLYLVGLTLAVVHP